MEGIKKKTLLTDAGVRGLPPAPKGTRYVVADTLVPGFKVRVSGTGSKKFFVYHRWGGAKNPSARTIGRVGDVSLTDARKQARDWLEMRTRGHDPKAHKPTGNIFGDLMEMYLAERVSRQRRAVRTTLEIRRDVLPRWQDRPIASIEKAEVTQWIKELAAKGHRRQPHNLFAHLRAFYNWAIDQDHVAVSPCDRVRVSNLIGPKCHREKTLTDDEIRALWRATDSMGYPWGAFYKLVLLTGARRSELGGMRWSEIDLGSGLWTVPPERFKGNRTNVVPLSDDAMAILRAIPRWKGSDVVFSSNSGRTPVTTYSKAAAKLKELMTAELDREPNFVLHDIRRTTRTGLAMVGVSCEVGELIIGHTPQGMGKVYNQYHYRKEMREGLETWGAEVRKITAEPVPFVLAATG